MKILFLYTELSGYFLACVQRFVLTYGAEVHIVRWPLHPDAPFQFQDLPGINMYERKDMSAADLQSLAEKISPDLLYVAGWMDKEYLQVARRFRKKEVPVLCAFDNHWRNDFRQNVAALFSGWFIHRNFSHAWVPGKFQFEFARKLGFPEERIRTGMYSADTAPFEKAWETSKDEKERAYPKQILFVARLVESKGILELLEAYRSLKMEGDFDWTLKVVGNGDLADKVKSQSDIELSDFVQPEELPSLASKAGVLVLPSRFEPWGVVVHEFAAAGLPIIASDACGSASALIEPGKNGFIHRAWDVQDLKEKLRKITNLNSGELMKMATHSHNLSKKYSPDKWAKTLFELSGKS